MVGKLAKIYAEISKQPLWTDYAFGHTLCKLALSLVEGIYAALQGIVDAFPIP